MSSIHYSFIMLTFNSDHYIETSLSAINDAIESIGKKSELYIIDNGSTDNTNKIISSFNFSENIVLVHLQLGKNTGTTFSRNIGLRSCSGNFIVVLDSDAYINPDALNQLQLYLDENRKCGIVVPKVIFPDGRYQLSTDSFPTITRKIYRYFFLRKIEKESAPKNIIDVDYAISAFWMMRKELLKDIGLLDEKIFYSPEDVDYCIRVWKQGFSVIYFPMVSVIHDAQEISRPKGFKILNFYSISHMKGLLYLYLKHKFIFLGNKFRR